MGRKRQRQAKSREWLHRQNRDPYVQQARKQGYRGRAVYKLKEIDEKYRLIKPGLRMVDLGAAPGSWSQYVAAKLKLAQSTQANRKSSQLVAIDLLPMEAIEGVEIVQGDFMDDGVFDQLHAFVQTDQNIDQNVAVFDLVLSDMAPNITGIALQDQGRYERLLETVLAFCQTKLRPGGHLLTKFFEGESAQRLRQQFNAEFSSVKAVKPSASRPQSREQYLLALGKK